MSAESKDFKFENEKVCCCGLPELYQLLTCSSTTHPNLWENCRGCIVGNVVSGFCLSEHFILSVLMTSHNKLGSYWLCFNQNGWHKTFCFPLKVTKFTWMILRSSTTIKDFFFLYFVCRCRGLPSGRSPAPRTTGSAHRTPSPTCGRSFTTSLRTKRSWRNACDTWGRRRRTGTTTSGPSRTSPSARLKSDFLKDILRACHCAVNGLILILLHSGHFKHCVYKVVLLLC